MRTVCVIGGGAAGMAAAISAADAGCSVLLLEKNEKLGKKLFITGKGRCNVTNAGEDRDFFEHVVTNPRFLYSSFYGFDNQAMMDLLTAEGLELKVERGNRVFPASDKSSDVIKTLEKALRRRNVRVRLNTGVSKLILENGCCTGVILSGGDKIASDAVIVATGGVSYSSTGSTGDGYRFARTAGHTVVDAVPALVPLNVREPEAGQLQGLSLKNIAIRIGGGKKPLYTDFGEMLFTHFGVSGPVILSASSRISRKLRETELPLFIDLKPALSEEQLDQRIRRDFEDTPNRQLKKGLDRLLPQRMCGLIIDRSGISPDKVLRDITKEERMVLVRLMKNLSFTVTGTRSFAEAIITQGGISVKEIDPATMESKQVRHLFFAGEVLDLDAQTGGYNLQIAWSTGTAAGKGAADADCD